MYKVDSYTFSAGFTHNLGDFESYRQDMTATVNLEEEARELTEEGAKIRREIRKGLRDTVHKELMKDYVEMRKKFGLDKS